MPAKAHSGSAALARQSRCAVKGKYDTCQILPALTAVTRFFPASGCDFNFGFVCYVLSA
jgi:hypothetical protein